MNRLKPPQRFQDRDRSILALHVDHTFQDSSTETARRCQKNADRILAINRTKDAPEHSFRVLKIPWSTPPYPSRPAPGEPVEAVGRSARYRTLFDGLNGASMLFMGHHNDDQIETAIMRYRKGSGPLGLSGMRPARRLGMSSGKDGSLDFYGPDGMQTWICRPLLGFSKVRS